MAPVLLAALDFPADLRDVVVAAVLETGCLVVPFTGTVLFDAAVLRPCEL